MPSSFGRASGSNPSLNVRRRQGAYRNRSCVEPRVARSRSICGMRDPGGT